VGDISPAAFDQLAAWLNQYKPTKDPEHTGLSRDDLAAFQKDAPLDIKYTIDQILKGDTYDRMRELVIEGTLNDSLLTRADLNRAATGVAVPTQTTTLFGRMWSSVSSMPSAIKHSALNSMGYSDVDLVRSSLQSTGTATQTVQTKFSDMTTALKDLAAATDQSNSPNLKFVDDIQAKLNDCEKAVQGLDSSIAGIRQASDDLFNQWEAELKQYNSADLRERSRKELLTTRSAYNGLIASIQANRDAIQPTLVELRDNVLAAHHAVDAQALTGWVKDKGAALRVNTDEIQKRMAATMTDITKFMATLPKPDAK